MKAGKEREFSLWIAGGNTGLVVESEQEGYYDLTETAKQELLDLFQSHRS